MLRLIDKSFGENIIFAGSTKETSEEGEKKARCWNGLVSAQEQGSIKPYTQYNNDVHYSFGGSGP